MSALPEQAALGLAPMTVADLDRVLAIENAAYAFPWTRGNFVDSLAAGYHARLLQTERGQPVIVGYSLAMAGPGELHLLNLTVAPAWQRRGLALRLLDDLVAHAQACALGQIWLEVREGNARAREIYRHYGFVALGRRRDYYPAGPGRREDAIVMGLSLDAVD